MTDVAITKLEWRLTHGMRYDGQSRNTLPVTGSLVVTWQVPYDHALALHCERMQFSSYARGETLRVRPVFSGFVPVLEGEWELYPPVHPDSALVEMLGALHDMLLTHLSTILTLPEVVHDDA